MPGGLLGADYEIANGHYRFRKIYTGESWNPQLQASAGRPGLNVTVGDYLLSVNGQDLTAKDDVSTLLENTAGKRVILRIASDPSGAQCPRDHRDPGGQRDRSCAIRPGSKPTAARWTS